MHATAAPVLLAAVLGLLTGAALARANMCMMRAAHDLAHGRFASSGGLLIASAAGAVVFFLSGLAGWHGRAVWAWPTALTVGGAVLFALGARLNAACSIGTVGRLANGDLGALAAITGMLTAVLLLPRSTLHDEPPVWAGSVGTAMAGAMAVTVVAFLAVARSRGTVRHLWAPLLLGAVAALLYGLHAQVTWMELATEAAKGAGGEANSWVIAAVGFVCLLAGAFGAAFFAGRVQWRKPKARRFGVEFVGGALMGAGSLLIPGATDALAFYGVPSGSPHALVAFLVLFGTIVASFRLFPASTDASLSSAATAKHSP